MILFIFQSLYFMLPAYFANMTPVLVKKVPILNYPLDFGKSINKIRIFGDHKTYRGFFAAILIATFIAYIQKFLFSASSIIREYSIIDYSATSPVLIGFLMGFGALLGDLIESFIKRRLNKKPGERWFPWDQMDFLPTTLLLVALIIIPPIDMIICLIVLSFVLRVWLFPIIQKMIGIVR